MCLWDCRTTDASPEISLQCACLAPGPGRRAPPHVLFAGTSGSPLSAVDPAPASIWRCRTQRLRKLSTTADGAAPGPFGYGAADLSVGAGDPADFAVAADGTGSGGRLPDDEIVPANSEPEPIQKKRATLGGSTLIAELREFT